MVKRRKKSIAFKIIVSIISIFVAILAIGFGSVYHLLNKVDNVKIDTENLNINTEEFKQFDNIKDLKEIKNIALLGIDSEDGVGRSDSIMIATIDTYHKKLKLTSIMRDSYVDIPDYGMDKINHAYAFGGPELSISTLNSNFGLNIDDFISVNFSSLPIIIDLLGGVDIEITEEEVPYIEGINTIGTYTLTGEQALSYSRIRYTTGGDYKRTERQRAVLNSLFVKMSKLPVTSYPEILSKVLPHVQSSMTSTDMISISTKAASLMQNGLQQERFPKDEYSEGTIIDDIYYLSFDLEITKQQIMNYIFDDK